MRPCDGQFWLSDGGWSEHVSQDTRGRVNKRRIASDFPVGTLPKLWRWGHAYHSIGCEEFVCPEGSIVEDRKICISKHGGKVDDWRFLRKRKGGRDTIHEGILSQIPTPFGSVICKVFIPRGFQAICRSRLARIIILSRIPHRTVPWCQVETTAAWIRFVRAGRGRVVSRGLCLVSVLL